MGIGAENEWLIRKAFRIGGFISANLVLFDQQHCHAILR